LEIVNEEEEKMRKIVMILFLVAIVVSAAFTAGKQEAAAAALKIVFYTPDWGIAFAERINEQFQKEKPNVTIELIRGPSAWADHVARCSLWIKTKYPGVDVLYEDDVFTLDGVAGGMWENLTPYLSDKEKNDLIGLQKMYQKEHGGIYRIPWWNGMSYMYYRKDILAKEGIAVPQTWDQLLQASKKLTRDVTGDGVADQWGYVTQGGPGEMYNNFTEFLFQAGGDEWKLAEKGTPTAEARKALKFMHDLYQEAAPPDLTTIDYNQSRALFREGKVAMLRDWADMGRAAASENLVDVGVMNFPAGPAGPWAIGHCWGLVVNKYGGNFKKNKQAVIDYARFQLRPEIHRITAEAEGPALTSVLDNEEFMASLAKQSIVIPYFKKFIEYRRIRKFPAGHSTEYHEGIGKIVTKCAVTGESGVDENILELQKWIDPLIAGLKK
jgi:ABC-type glycerol-3-phosphate transport system substrate-binding protein